MIAARTTPLILMNNELSSRWHGYQVAERLFLLCCLLVPLLARAEDAWTKGLPLVTRPQHEIKEGPFILAVWSGMDNHVHGLCSYVNTRAERITLHGIRLKDGDFYPTVHLAVGGGKDKWNAIKSSPQRGKAASLVVKAHAEPDKALKVDLDPFLSYIGKYSLGRITLETGEAAEFELTQLLPPESK